MSNYRYTSEVADISRHKDKVRIGAGVAAVAFKLLEMKFFPFQDDAINLGFTLGTAVTAAQAVFPAERLMNGRGNWQRIEQE